MLEKKNLSCLVVIVLLLFFGCKKEVIQVNSLSYNYFPTEKGVYVIYDVDSIFHAETDNQNDDSVYSYHFQIKERIDTSFLDLQGRTNQVLLRFKRIEVTDSWMLTAVWTQFINSTVAYRTEDNIIYHKLSFPINSTTTWNGNDSNTLDEEDYFYDYFHESSSVNGLSFDSTLSVIQIDENNYVEKIFGNEKYANGIGMIYKEKDDLGKKNGQVVKGTEYKMQINSFGKE